MIEWLILFTLFYILVVAIAWKFRKRKKHTLNNDDILALDLSREELYKSLNFMLMYGIIDFEQYNQIERKSLSYLKG